MKCKTCFLCIMTIALLFSFVSAEQSITPVSEQFIRIHVIANSDEPEDQALKLRVRDRLLNEYGEGFQSTTTMKDARFYITNRLNDMEKTALEEIHRSGYAYAAVAEFGTYAFPTRAYGDKLYPAGRYEALRLVIGGGQGANWWCVMFPPLCFVDISSGTLDTSARDKSETPGKAGSMVQSQALEDPEIVYRFKLAEWWQTARQKVSHLFSK